MVDNKDLKEGQETEASVEANKETLTLELKKFDHVLIIQNDGSIKFIFPMDQNNAPLNPALVKLVSAFTQGLVALIEQTFFHGPSPEKPPRKNN